MQTINFCVTVDFLLRINSNLNITTINFTKSCIHAINNIKQQISRQLILYVAT